MNLLLLKDEDMLPGGRAKLSGRRALHIASVLRAKEGDVLKCGFLGGKLGSATLGSVSKNEVELRDIALNIEAPAPVPLTLIVALPRPQSFKKLLHFIASSGIKEAFFVSSARVEKSYWKSSALVPEAIEEELLLGLEQGVDSILPKLEFKKRLKPFIEDELPGLSEGALKLIGHPDATEACPKGAGGRTFLAVGPEGGFVDSELELFKKAGFQPVSIGKRILRVEFAAAFLAGRIL